MTATLAPQQIPTGVASRATGWRIPLRERIAPYAYIAPFFLLFGVFGLVPFLFTFYIALFDWNPIGDQTFIGAGQLRPDARATRGSGTRRATRSASGCSRPSRSCWSRSCWRTCSTTPGCGSRCFFRMSILVPYITSVAATAIVFAQMFDRDYGLLNWLLGLRRDRVDRLRRSRCGAATS